MDGTISPFFLCEGCGPLWSINSACRACLSTRTCRVRGKSPRGVTRATKPFRGDAPVIATCQASHWAVHCYATALWSPCGRPLYERGGAGRYILEVPIPTLRPH